MANMDVYLPFDTGPGANVTEDGWRKMMRHINGSASGVVRGFQNDMLVYADSTGMQVKVQTGECLMRGHYGSNDTEKTLPIAASHATLPRIDRGIIRADFLNNLISLEVLTGTAASTPAPPAVTQSSTIWETSLATVNVAAASVTVAPAAVIDDRVFTSVNAKYRKLGASTQTVNNTFAKLIMSEVTERSGDVTHNAALDEFTLNRAGLWSVNARVTYIDNAVAGGTGIARQIFIVDPAGGFVGGSGYNLVYGATSTPGVAGVNATLTCVAQERFPAGKKIALSGWVGGTAVGVSPIDLTFMWIGP